MQTMKDVVNYHEKKQQQYRGRHGGMVYLFSKTIEGGTVSVVAEVKKTEAWLVSGFFEE
jgi:hypothetical protein